MSIYKKIVITSLCLILVGLALASIGYLSGGKTALIKNKIGYSIKDDYKRISEKEKLEAFKNIQINANYLDNIEIVKGEEYKIEVNYSERIGEINYKVENGSLIVNQSSNKETIGFDFGFINKEPDYIKIYIPKDKNMSNLVIESENSDIKVENIDGDTVSILCNYGEVNLNNILSNDMSIKAKSGDIDMKNIKSSALEVINDYGDTTFEAINSNDFMADIKNGDVYINNIEVLQNFNIENDYGEVDIANSRLNKFKAIILNGDIDINNSNIVSSNIENSYGEVNYSINNSENLYNYSLNCNYGDININGKELGENLEKSNNANNNININSENGDINLNFK
ncbi:DUF4097 family beta strand repeat-containing protein [[Clostridium] dakarense]|uniref:DUF4097 family beta strand repeat-containing protein n=1 Tax=Faecalimicrobium dakarense TaxID=1301100 RepID=UPI0004AFA715|nr:DUF4097 family beta strand repeat-containing protein [[Clostridium] dakarense]